jgi:hypothetical protein
LVFASQTLALVGANSGVNHTVLVSTALYRDPSAWYHIVASVDTTQATASNRAKLYVNGVQVTALSTATYPSQNTDTSVNNTVIHSIGALRIDGSYAQFLNGYLTEINFIDGQALTPSSFGETDPITGVWTPKKYTGSYGAQGWYLNFSDNSGTTSTTLGKDSSGNGNNWTPNNFSVTAGAGNDSLVDSPTRYGTDTGAGGEVRGNYATFNPLWKDGTSTISDGNLLFSGGNYAGQSTLIMSSGKWYFEATVTTGTSTMYVGIVEAPFAYGGVIGNTNGGGSYAYTYYPNGNKYVLGSASAYGSSWGTVNDVIGVALNLDANTITFYKNGVSQGAISIASGKSWVFSVTNATNTGAIAGNFGARPYSYTAPSGFKALVTTNLPEPTIKQGDDYFNAVLYTGTNATQTINVGFEPGLVWGKSRTNIRNNNLYDQVRGTGNMLITNATNAELTGGELTAFTSSGFTLGTNVYQLNASGDSLVAWNWKANGAGVSNTAGTITSTVSVNTTSGFSIVSFAFPSVASKTVGHGLGVVPSMIIWKSRSNGVQNWIVYHVSTGNTGYLILNTTNAFQTNSTVWDNTSPTSSVFTLGSGATSGNFGANGIAYCFAAVPGYSAFGSYTGNGSTDGPFVYTGFKPAFLLIKNTTTNGYNWILFDNERIGYNTNNYRLYPNLSNAEQTTTAIIDLLSNGFKPRNTDGEVNVASGNFIYMAFAENPFAYALAR